MRHREQRLGQGADEEEDELDLSIVGDEEEEHRIQLENNLQDISIQLSLTNPSQASDHDPYDAQPYDGFSGPAYTRGDTEGSYSLEYPRHNSIPHDVSIFHGHNSSLMDHSHMENEYESHLYSYRTADDDEGIHPYGGDTMSTAAHHASGLTLNAGLGVRGGRRAYGGDVSLSGAEYDPDRPLEKMMNGIVKDMSMFDMNSTRTKAGNHNYASAHPQVTFDPHMGGGTAPLDSFHHTNHSHGPVHHSSDLRGSYSSHSASEPDTPDAGTTHLPHSRLGDALSRVGGSFSPKRPRSAQPISPSYLPKGEPTPKARTRTGQPAVNVQPPTPSTGGSKFTKMAKGLAKDIEENQWRATHAHQEEEGRILAHSTARPKSKSKAIERNPFQDIVNHSVINIEPSPLPATRSVLRRSTNSAANTTRASRKEGRNPSDRFKAKDKVHLPDVTGLTSAVGSPIKHAADWWGYPSGDVDGAEAAHLLQTLTNLQTRLNQLESQNLVSRRRVRELEMELESCKADVKRERTRVLEREEIIVAQQREVDTRKKGKGKAVRMDESAVDESRYKEVVEEKKALEALIATLRTHLTRLTSELSSHQTMINELRALRDSDVRAIQEKMSDVDGLKMQVERLGGEVEVLRGVIEEGLNERRRVKQSLNMSVGETSYFPNQQAEEGEEARYGGSREGSPTPSSRPHSPLQSQPQLPDKTMRTDHATIGSSRLGGVSGRRYVEDDELERVSAELEERRSERSNSALSQEHLSLSGSEPQTPVYRRDENKEGEEDVELDPPPFTHNEPTTAHVDDRHVPARQRVHVEQQTARPSGPTPARASGQSHSRPHPPNTQKAGSAAPPETPFPQIRGERLERMFFSAPEHNAKTCAVCHRRRRPSSPDVAEASTRYWLPSRRHFKTRVENAPADDEDEGFEEGSEEIAQVSPKDRLKGKERLTFVEEERLPPQTVLARVLRELEDDFTHYKGIYVELADQYKLMDAASNVPKRNVLAEHLKDVINTLEQKGDQIASLYDLLSFKDKPVPQKDARHSHSSPPGAISANAAWGRQRGLKKHPTYA